LRRVAFCSSRDFSEKLGLKIKDLTHFWLVNFRWLGTVEFPLILTPIL